MFQGGGDSAPAVEMKDFIKEQTGVEIEIDVIPPESLHEKQLAAFTSGRGDYDIMELYPTWIGEYAEAGYIENLDPLYEKYASEINIDDFIEGAQVGFDKYQGSWYAIPYDGDVNIFYYRKDLWDDAKEQEAFKAKYGYDLKVPDTWEEVRDMAEFFNRPRAGAERLRHPGPAHLVGRRLLGQRLPPDAAGGSARTAWSTTRTSSSCRRTRSSRPTTCTWS